jgi:hypothetical protein
MLHRNHAAEIPNLRDGKEREGFIDSKLFAYERKHSMNSKKLTPWLIAILSTGLLTACGGGTTNDSTTVTASATPTQSDPPGCVNLTYTANTAATGNPHTNASKICMLASTTQLQFSGKTLSSPTQNTVVSAPFSAYAFLDGTIKYEVVFRNTAIYEVNVNSSNNSVFYGQFEP